MNDEGKIEHEVSLHLLELGIKLYCRSTGDLVLHFPYPKVLSEKNTQDSLDRSKNFLPIQRVLQSVIFTIFQISACGCNATDPRYVAFISGDNLCRLAKTFLCHVFYASDVNVARDIVHHMANGFERTLTTA